MKEVKFVRFPNESFFDKVEIDIKEFTPEKELKNETFGKWCGLSISILNDKK